MSISFNAVYIEITSDCMLSCLYCYHGARKNAKKFFPLERYQILLEELPEKAIVDLSGGEPLLHPNICEIIHLTAEKNFQTRLITNGLRLIELSKQELFLIDTIAISLDGITCDVHDAVRGQGSFCKMEKGLAKLYDIGLSNRVTFNVTVGQWNKENLEDYILYAIKWGASIVNFENLHKIPGEYNSFVEKETLSIDESLNLYNQTKEFQKMYQDKITIVPSRFVGGSCPLIMPNSSWGLRIDTMMNVYPCEGFCGTEFSLGNLSEQSLVEVINGNKCKEIVSFLRTRIEQIESCHKCVLKGIICQGGCAADAYFQQADCLCTDGACHVRLHRIYEKLINS